MKDALYNALLTLTVGFCGLLCVALGFALLFGVLWLGQYCVTLYPPLWYVFLFVAFSAFLGHLILTDAQRYRATCSLYDSQSVKKDSL